MPVFQWRKSWNPLHDLERQMDRLLESIRMPFPAVRVERHYPAVNIYELEKEYLLCAEVPGVAPEQLELTVSQGVLTLKGVRSAPEGVPEEHFRRHERVRGSWQRSISLPERVHEEKISAEFSEGVLKIHLPKAELSQPRQIRVVSLAP